MGIRDTSIERCSHRHGGCTCGSVVASTEFYEGGYWYAGPSMTMPRYEDTATLLSDGNLLVAGGEQVECCSVTAKSEIYTPTLVGCRRAGGPPGQDVTVSGSGFYAGERVRVTFDYSATIGHATTNANRDLRPACQDSVLGKGWVAHGASNGP